MMYYFFGEGDNWHHIWYQFKRCPKTHLEFLVTWTWIMPNVTDKQHVFQVDVSHYSAPVPNTNKGIERTTIKGKGTPCFYKQNRHATTIYSSTAPNVVKLQSQNIPDPHESCPLKSNKIPLNVTFCHAKYVWSTAPPPPKWGARKVWRLPLLHLGNDRTVYAI